MRTLDVLIVEDDEDIGVVVQSILEDEGLATARLRPGAEVVLQEAATRLAPYCILLDGAGRGGYGHSWFDAIWLHAHLPAIPVIMFSADARATREAQQGTSARCQAAAFAAVLEKPFEIDELLELVNGTISRSWAGVPVAKATGLAADRPAAVASGAMTDIHAGTRALSYGRTGGKEQ